MAVVQEYNLNIIPQSSPVIVNVNQYDKEEGRFIFHLYQDSEQYTPSSGAVGEIQGSKPDGRGFQYYVREIDGNSVTCDLTMQMSAVAGRTRGQLIIHETSGQTGTFNFWLEVQESALPANYDLSESEYSVVEQMIEAAEQAAQTIAYGVEDAEAWATGERQGEPVLPGDATYHNNSKYYSEQSAGSATASAGSAEDAESWADGKRNGTPVSSSDPAYHNNARYWSDEASSSAGLSDASAEDSEAYAVGKRDGSPVTSGDPAYHNNSKYYSEQSANSAVSADNSAEDSEAWAIGERDGTPVTSGDTTYHNNAKYWAGESSDSATAAATSETAADGFAEDAEAYAVGKRDGTDVTSGDPAYHNNAKYYAGQAANSATSASNSETAAENSAEDAEAWAVGQRDGTDVPSSDPAYKNNSKYYANWVEDALDNTLPEFEIDPSNGHLYQTKGALMFAIDANGHLTWSL